ncbi:hypothetical protein DFH07DRAFT_766676 [Mycena maculata]|uniref:Uncharacterized protein n=1 Tax=Mycena maculata TaxID=230809 RepID=A0AAD7K677_9AGAR|nr:hypothetical protein DFH07DRAFT_766676 [Mycena maculata]
MLVGHANAEKRGAALLRTPRVTIDPGPLRLLHIRRRRPTTRNARNCEKHSPHGHQYVQAQRLPDATTERAETEHTAAPTPPDWCTAAQALYPAGSPLVRHARPYRATLQLRGLSHGEGAGRVRHLLRTSPEPQCSSPGHGTHTASAWHTRAPVARCFIPSGPTLGAWLVLVDLEQLACSRSGYKQPWVGWSGFNPGSCNSFSRPWLGPGVLPNVLWLHPGLLGYILLLGLTRGAAPTPLSSWRLRKRCPRAGSTKGLSRFSTSAGATAAADQRMRRLWPCPPLRAPPGTPTRARHTLLHPGPDPDSTMAQEHRHPAGRKHKQTRALGAPRCTCTLSHPQGTGTHAPRSAGSPFHAPSPCGTRTEEPHQRAQRVAQMRGADSLLKRTGSCATKGGDPASRTRVVLPAPPIPPYTPIPTLYAREGRWENGEGKRAKDKGEGRNRACTSCPGVYGVLIYHRSGD